MAKPPWFRQVWTGLGRRLGDDDRTKGDVWQAAARRLGAAFVPAKGNQREEIHHDHGAWRIVVDLEIGSDGTRTTVRTRARAPFSGRRELRLTARPRRVWHGWLEATGVWRRPPLSPALLERYAVRGGPAGRIPSVFSPALIDALRAAPPTLLDVGPASRKLRRRLGEKVGRVRARTEGVLTEEDALVALVRVVVETLEALRRIGEADGTTLPGSASRDGSSTIR